VAQINLEWKENNKKKGTKEQKKATLEKLKK